MRPEVIFPLFLVVWLALLGFVAWFYAKAPLATRRRWHPFVIGGGALVFLGFVTLIMPAKFFVVMVPAVALISFVNYKVTKFCNDCGATVVQVPGRAKRNCPKCGVLLRVD